MHTSREYEAKTKTITAIVDWFKKTKLYCSIGDVEIRRGLVKCQGGASVYGGCETWLWERETVIRLTL